MKENDGAGGRRQIPNSIQITCMKISKAILAFTFSCAALVSSRADTFKIDPVHSSVIFNIKHLGVTNFYGDFKEVTGTVTFDSADPSKSSVELSIPVESLDSRNPKRDQHLKSPDFFNAAQFPTLNFKSTKIEASGDVYKVSGDLTIHGVTKPVTVDFHKGAEAKGQQGEVRSGGETKFTMKRSDYGMSFMQGALGDEVNIVLSLEGIKQ